jgi:hypothetical protein
VGVYGGPAREHVLACSRSASAQTLSDTGWRMKNQPSPGVWLSGSPTAFTVPPNGNVAFTALLRGLGYVPWRVEPFAGVLRLSSNDPLQPQTDLAAQVIAGPPAHVLWLPVVGR